MKIRQKLRTILRILKNFGVKGLIAAVQGKLKSSRETHIASDFDLRAEGFIPISLTSSILITMLEGTPDRMRLADKDFRELELLLDKGANVPRQHYYEDIFDLGKDMSRFLYVSCRTISPKLVVETGVAAGMSSTVILSAIEKNGHGNLVSIDISTRVGELIPKRLRGTWTLEVLPLSRKEANLQKLLLQYRNAEIFLHDSDHSDYWQKFEFDSAFSILNTCNLFLFDDVSLSLLRHIRNTHPEIKVFVLNEGRKHSAIILRS